jgi:DNA-binding Xre family transcriptional regulator
MTAHYKKLWKMLIDRDIKRSELAKKTGLSGSTLTKLTRGENVNISVLIKICAVLKCTLDDIVELVPDDGKLDKSGE